MHTLCTIKKAVFILSLYLFYTPFVLFAQDPFVELSPFGSDAGASNGVSWADYDGDGDEDIYICNGSDYTGQANFMYRNDGSDTFTKITSGAIVTDSYISGFCTWGDFDNDNDLDLYVSSIQNFLGSGKQNCLYENSGSGTFTKNTTAGPPVDDAINSAAVGWGDYNNDSYLDLFVTNGYTGAIENTLYANDGDKTFTSITGIDLVSSSNATGIAGFGWADYDGDGDLDIFTASGGGANREKNYLWRNDGSNVFVKLTLFDEGESQGGSWGDYDNDGDLDLYITNYGTSETTQEENFLYRNDGSDTFTKMSPAQVGDIVDEPIISKGSAWGDIDNDGDLDMFVSTPGDMEDPTYDYANRLYINDGSGYFTRLTGSVIDGPGFCFGTAMADYNKDGFLDILVATSNANLIYKNNEPNNGNTNHWIQIKLAGTTSNRSGIGATVRLTATINSEVVEQMREIAGITGFGQSSLLAHFGLGNASTITEIRVEWPSGIIQTITDVSVDQILTVTESGSSESITVTAPNGGESWEVASVQTITWTSSGTSGTVKLEYSTDDGSNWTEIEASITDDGSYDWTVPDTPSDLCLVRVSDTDGNPSDVSNGVFSIVAPGKIGDVNNDDTPNSTDALIILSCDVGLDVTSFCPMDCGDVNDDGLINSTDALIILSYDVGISISFPVGESGCYTGVTPCLGCNP
ncbi:hypothetical protein EH223_06490 [candidate division KSB1 bacterium]|nr:VCBS repeat-containing protein [candidate division KSB1 bacterium]RQW04801.1 MAG: hypothetical protein EH223_06490 [candidate division KSB1 bacterium]